MTAHAAAVEDAEADIRWREWQSRGAEGDRRRTARIYKLSVVMSVGAAIWLLVQFL